MFVCFVHGRCKKRQSQSKGTGPKPFCHILAQSLQKLADILSLVRITTVSNSISHKWISWFLIAQVRSAKGITFSVRNSLTSLDINDVTLIVEDNGAVQASFVNNSIDIDVNYEECVNISVDVDVNDADDYSVDNNVNNLLYIFQISSDVNRQMFWS